MGKQQKQNFKHGIKNKIKIKDNKDVQMTTKEDLNEAKTSTGILGFFETVSVFMLRYMRGVGIRTLRHAKRRLKKAKRFYHRHLASHTKKVEVVLLKGIKLIFKGIRFLGYRVYLFLHFFVDAQKVLKKAFNKQKDKNICVRLYDTGKALGKGVKNNRSVFSTMINYTLPVAAVICFVYVINYTWQLNFAVSVEYNGQHIGYIQNEAVFEQAEAKLQQRMHYINDEETIDKIPKFSVAVIPKADIQTDLQLTDAIIKSSSQDIIQATGISVDGVFYGAVKNGDMLQNLLDEKLEKFKTGNENEVVHFTKDVKLETGFFVAKNITAEKQILETLDSELQDDAFYTIVENDTPLIIASKNDMTLDALQKLNPDILTNCVVGKTVLVNKSEAFLPVSVTTTETYKANIPYPTQTINSTKYYKGNKVVTKKGSNGEKLVTAKIERVDGAEISREILSSTITKEAVTQVITNGTGVFYQDNSPYSGSVSDVGFIWPVSGSYTSSGYGRRGWFFHTGIDLAFRGNGYGAPIRAVAAGKVIYSGWSGSYGRLVKIDHGGGVQTWYAHASSLIVRSGQIVSQGETISRVGSSGNSTGNHLHFEVRINGSTVNPRNYLP